MKNIDVEENRARAEAEVTELGVRVISSDVVGAFIASLLDREEGRPQTIGP